MPIVLAGIAVAVACVWAMRAVLGQRMWSRIGMYFIVAALVFHIGTEVVSAVGDSPYRAVIPQADIDRWLLVIIPALAILTTAYLATTIVVESKTHEEQATSLVRRTAEFFDWRICLLATAPLYLLALQGKGFVPTGDGVDDSYFLSGLTTQYLQLGISITAVAYILATGRLMRALVIQSVALILLGQRLPVVAGLIIVGYLVQRCGYRPTRRQVHTIIAMGILAAVVVSSARVTASRAEFAGGSGPADRVTAITGGLEGLGTLSFDAIADDWLYRFDGNAYGARILERQHRDGSVGTATIRNSVALAVPSFLMPGKLEGDVTTRSEKAYVGQFYGFNTLTFDYLPTLLGGSVAWYGWVGVLVVALLMGVALGLLDRWLVSLTPTRMIVAAGALLTALYYERGFDGVTVTARGVLSFAAVVWALTQVQQIARSARTRTRARGEPSRTTRLSSPSPR